MKRPPWIAIVFGVCAWSGVIALAVSEIWWPLYVVGGVTVFAMFSGLFAMIAVRRMVKRSPEALVREPAPARTEPVAEPPQRTGGSRPRTNARTAGRRNKGAATAVAVGLWLVQAHGCRRGDENKDEDAKAGEAKAGEAKAGEAKAGGAPAVPAMTGEDPVLVAALSRAIRPPPTGEATYRIDPFVAVLVFERVKAGVGPTLTRLEKPIQGGPQAGFIVGEVAEGSLAHRLGLRTGDVVEAINGVVLMAPDRVGFALDGAGKLVELTIHRDEVSVVQRYEMDESLAWTELLAGFTGDADPRVAAADGGAPAGGAVDGGALDGAAGDEGTPADDGRGEGAAPVEPAADDGGTTPSGGSKLPSGGGGGGTKPTPTPTPTPTPGPRPTPSPTPTPTPGGGPVSCESSSKCTVQKAHFDSLVANPSKLESQANIVPAIANDVHSGYKIKSIKPGSTIAKLGFQSNDKITHINGFDLTDDFQAAQLYMGVSSTKLFKIRYERGGSKLVKTVIVK